MREYAQKIKSSPGKKDGLYWPTGDDGDVSPLGPLVESAQEFMKTRKSTDPVGGYYWKILTGQGRCAPGGAHPYIINGNMIAGCALIGFPAEYGQTGIMTFIVSHHGRLLERDMGPGTANYVNAVQLFSPDPSWQIVKD